ncbi:uncharacterized protein L201_001648 [Kwoniella dendrophila CBS 6074]|uniref:Uncharacterized protein n=1 Tax=Kwoniella dendrophila CBS 6074 TaxID=1295534 RepID=A0AAX4JPU7_9TREE
MNSSLSCKSPPTGVITPRPKRDKMKQKLYAVLGNSYPMDRSVPMEFKVSYPKGNFKNFNKFNHKGERPNYLGERLKAPGWWRHEAVVSVFDKILADKHKKPTLIQRLMKSGVPRPQAQLSVGEQLAKAMMRRRALHYVETRDDLELKVAKINKRLLKLIQEGDHWKKQFEMFEKYADRLTVEANELKTKIEKERREAKRLSNLATEQTQQNVQLEEKLKNTEDARAEAMRQLSDMHHSIQELEREREEIMNSLETQINGALAGLPISSNDSNASSSRPSTPNLHNDTLSTMSSRGSTKSRPALAYSMISSQSKAMSVLGQVKGNNYNNQRTLGGHVHGNGNTKQDKLNKRASVMSSVTVDTERTSHNQSGSGISGNDAISQRIASVQAKLELALNVVSSQRSSSVMTTSSTTSSDDGSGSESGNETDTEDGNEGEPQKIRKTNNEEDVKDGFETDKDDQNNKTPTASRRPSDADIVSGGLTENKEVQPPLPKLPNNDNHESSQGDPVESSTANGTDDGNSKLKVSANITNRPTSASTIKPNPTSTSNSTPIIMKPRLRTKVNINTNDNKDGDTTKKHKIKVTRNITPPSGSESDASNLTAHHVHKEDDNEQQRHDEEVDSDGKRLSILSSRSIQFGQAV